MEDERKVKLWIVEIEIMSRPVPPVLIFQETETRERGAVKESRRRLVLSSEKFTIEVMTLLALVASGHALTIAIRNRQVENRRKRQENAGNRRV